MAKFPPAHPPHRARPSRPWNSRRSAIGGGGTPDSSQSALAGTSGALKPSSMQAAAHAIRGGIRWRNHAGTPLIGLPDPSGQNSVTGPVSRESRHVTFSKKIGAAQNSDVARWGAFHTRTDGGLMCETQTATRTPFRNKHDKQNAIKTGLGNICGQGSNSRALVALNARPAFATNATFPAFLRRGPFPPQITK